MKNFGRVGEPDLEKININHGREVFKVSGTLETVDYHIETNISWIEVT